MGEALGYWAIVTTEAGAIGEKIKYWIPGEVPPRSERKKKSDLRKQRQNENNANRRVARLIHANFPWGSGMLLLLDYSPEGVRKLTGGAEYNAQDERRWDDILCAGRKELGNYIRRCRRACKKAGVPLRYLAFTSDLRWDGKAQEYVHTRIHHHLVVNPEAAELCKAAWRLGGAGDRRMKKTADHTDLACYLMDQCRRIDESKKYVPSRNLAKPLERTPRVSCSSREVQPPKGAILLYRSPFEVGRPQYIRYILPKWRERYEQCCADGEEQRLT